MPGCGESAIHRRVENRLIDRFGSIDSWFRSSCRKDVNLSTVITEMAYIFRWKETARIQRSARSASRADIVDHVRCCLPATGIDHLVVQSGRIREPETRGRLGFRRVSPT